MFGFGRHGGGPSRSRALKSPGTFSCTWPPANLFALAALESEVSGTFEGNVNPVTHAIIGTVDGSSFLL